MCELFGISAEKNFRVNELLDTFYSHSIEHKDGWGLAVFRGRGVSLEKEAVRAVDSSYLHQRLGKEISAANLLAHIRKATIGRMEYANCHPFIWDDGSGRTWTLIHNGTIFNGEVLAGYGKRQEGTTDSERVLLHIVDVMDRAFKEKGREPDFAERFALLDSVFTELSDGNKLIVLLYDGEYMYVHTNREGSLVEHREEGKRIFATRPVLLGGWDPLPMNRLLAYREGRLIREGTVHGHTFRDEEHDMTSLYSAFSEL